MIDELKGMRLAVLYGGTSCEREVSLVSGKAVYEALCAQGLRVELVDAVGSFMDTLKKNKIDLVFIALHGTFGEDGQVQRLLEAEGILYTGPGVAASSAAFDKARTQMILSSHGVSVPPFQVFGSRDEALRSAPDYPVVVKPSRSGSSVGVGLVADASRQEAAVNIAFEYSDTILIEKYIRGRELTVGFLGDQPLPIVEVIASRAFYDYEAKYRDNQTRYEFPAKLTPEQERRVSSEAVKAAKALGCGVLCRVDVMMDDQGKPWVLEINTIPGLTPKSLLPKAAQAAGIPFSGLCVRILELALAKTKAVP